MIIPLIKNPHYFEVNLRPYVDAQKIVEPSLAKRVQKTVLCPFEWVKLLSVAIVQSGYTTLSYSWVSFKYHVLDYYGPLGGYKLPDDFYLVILKVIVWVMRLSWGFVTTTLCLFVKQVNPTIPEHFLTCYAGEGIDLSHLRTNERDIDVSNIPPDITVSTLRTLFQRINFNNNKSPGYMAPSSRKAGNIIYTVQELTASLEIFIQNVEKRKAFIGTPPLNDTPRLMAFYQQIENAIRFSIHKVTRDFEEFISRHGGDYSVYEQTTMREYENLLETQARVAIDMAIAGQACGARYMSEAMSTYFSLSGKTACNGTLQESLIEVLASKRLEIAQRHAYRYVGNDAHDLPKYMETFGGLLGLPGTNNIIEHLASGLNYDELLKHFFDEYSVDFIIDAVQEKIKQSQSFREKIIDWLQDQVGEWNKPEADRIQQIANEMMILIERTDERNELSEEIQDFITLMSYLKSETITWPAQDNLDDFIDNLFALPQTKEWFDKNLQMSLVEKAQKKQNIKQKLKQSLVTAQIIIETTLQDKPIPWDKLYKQESNQRKIDELRRILPIQRDTFERILEGKVSVRVAIEDYLNFTRRIEFIHALNLTNIETEGVSSGILEWLLVSHKILMPQQNN